MVDRMGDSGDFRDGGFNHGLEAPPLGAAGGDGFPVGVLFELIRRGRVVARIGGAHRDPGAEIFDDLRVELRSVFRHLEIFDFVGDAAEKEGIVRFSGDKSRARLAAFFPAGSRVEKESTLCLRCLGVTFVALLREDGADARFEEFALAVSEGRGFSRSQEKEQQSDSMQPFHARSLLSI